MAIDAINRLIPITQIDAPRELREEEEHRAAIVTAVRALNKSEFFGNDRELRFERDHDTGRLVIQIVKRETGEKLEQVPPESLLRIMASIAEGAKGDK